MKISELNKKIGEKEIKKQNQTAKQTTKQVSVKKTGNVEQDGMNAIRQKIAPKDAYKKYMGAKAVVAQRTTPKQTSGGTVNPIITTPTKQKTYQTEAAQRTARRNSIQQNVQKEQQKKGVTPQTPTMRQVKEMILGQEKNGGTVNPTISAVNFSSKHDMMNKQERSTYAYLKQTGQEKQAKSYLKAIEYDVNKRSAEARTKKAEQLARNNKVAGLYDRYMASLTAPLGAAYGGVQALRGEAVDPNSPFYMGEHTREGNERGMIGDSKGATAMLKQAGLTAYDWGTQMATLGFLGGGAVSGATELERAAKATAQANRIKAANMALFGASAFGGNTREAAGRGANSGQILGYGAVGAAAEVLTENIGFERLLKFGEMAGGKSAIKNVVKAIIPNMFSEGMEESSSEVANILADAIILGDKGQMLELYNGAKAQGLTDGQAAKVTLTEAAKQIAQSGAVGAISGGMIAGGIGGAGRVMGKNPMEDMAKPEGGEEAIAQLKAEKEAAKIAKTKQETTPEVAETAAIPKSNTEPLKRNSEALEGNSEAQANTNIQEPNTNIKETNTNATQTNTNTTQTDTNVQKPQVTASYGEKYFYENGRKALAEAEATHEGVNFLPDWQRYYTAGLNGQSRESLRQTGTVEPDALFRAYEAGIADKRADMEARLKGQGKTGQGRVILSAEGITEGEKALANLVAQYGGMDVEIVEALENGNNGVYHSEKGLIKIALDADSFSGTLFHESVHYIREINAEGFEKMRTAVFEMAAELEGKTVDDYISEYEKAYGDLEQYNYDDILEEMVADAFMKVAADQNSMKRFLTNLQQQDRGLMAQLKEWLMKLLESLDGLLKDNRFYGFTEDITKNIENTKKLIDLFTEELTETGKKGKAETANATTETKAETTETQAESTGIEKENDEVEGEAKFSLKQPVEETKDLIAVHNMTAENLEQTLKLGGMPMPSIAVVKDSMGHEKYGEISLLFDKESIDPEADKRNTVYGADAWTPTVPQVDHQVDYEKKRTIENEIYKLSEKVAGGIFAKSGLLSSKGVDDITNLTIKELAEKLSNDEAAKAAYLAEQGKDITPEYKPKEYSKFGNEAVQKLIDEVGADKVADMRGKLITGERLNNKEETTVRNVIREEKMKKHRGFISRRPEPIRAQWTEERFRTYIDKYMEEQVGTLTVEDFVIAAGEYYKEDGTNAKTIDRMATYNKLEDEVSNQEVIKWLEGKLEGLLGEAGVYNGKDYYDSKGNRRSFKQLHYPYTLQNIVKAMQAAQKERGEGMMGMGAERMVVENAKKYKTIEDIKKDKERLRLENDEAYQAELERLDGEITEIIRATKKGNKPHFDNEFIESDRIGEVMTYAIGKKTIQTVQNVFKKEGYAIDKEIAGRILKLFEDSANIPTGYFEAKPQRAVGLDEIKAVVAPKNMDSKLKAKLEGEGIIIEEYDPETEGDRLRAMNEFTDLKFSRRMTEGNDLREENEELRKMNEHLKAQLQLTKGEKYDRASAKAICKSWLKEMDSRYDAEAFTDRFLKLCEMGKEAVGELSYSRVITGLQNLAYDALEQSESLDTRLYDTYKDLRTKIRETTIKATDSLIEEMEYLGGYREIQKSNFGRMRFSKNKGIEIDSLFQELAEEYPEFFNTEETEAEGDQLVKIMSVLDSLQPKKENEFGHDLGGYARDAAYELFDKFQEVQLQKPTFADKKKAQLEKAREEYKADLQSMREAFKKDKEHAIYRLKKEMEERNEKWRENYKERNEKAWERAKAEHKEALKNVKEEQWNKAREYYALKEEMKYKKRKDRELYYERRRILNKNVKTLRKWIETPKDNLYHIQEKDMPAVLNFLSKLSLTNRDGVVFEQYDFTQLQRELEALQENGPIYMDLGEEFSAWYEIFNGQKEVNLNELSGFEMATLSNIVAAIKKAVMDSNKLMASEQQKKVSDLGDAYIQRTDRMKKTVQYGIRRKIYDFLNLEMADAWSVFHELGPEFEEAIGKEYQEGMDKFITTREGYITFMNETVDPKTVKKWREMDSKTFKVGGQELTLSIPQIMSLYCLMKREQAKRHILKGGMKAAENKYRKRLGKKAAAAALREYAAVTPTYGEIDTILETLTPEQKKVCDAIQKYLSEEVSEWGNETSMLMWGYKKFKEKFYFPIKTDKDYINKTFGMDDQNGGTLQSMGASKQTNRFANNPLVLEDIFTVFAEHCEQMNSYNAFVPVQSDMNKFMNYRQLVDMGGVMVPKKSVSENMKGVMGPKAEGYLNELMKRVNGAVRADDTNGLPKIMLKNMKVAAVGANLRVIIQQPTSYIRALAVLDPQYLLAGLVPGKINWGEIYEYAPIAKWKEDGNYELDTGRSTEDRIMAPSYFKRATEAMMAGAGIADKITWGHIWKACMAQAQGKAKGKLSHEAQCRAAAELFNEVVNRTQVVDSIFHRSQMMRSKNFYKQMATSFMSEPIKTFNLARTALLDYTRDRSKENGAKLIRATFTLALNGIGVSAAAAVIDMVRSYNRDDKDGTMLERWMAAFRGDYADAESSKDYLMAALSSNLADNLNPFNMIPYFKDAFSIMQGYDLKRTEMDWLADLKNTYKKWEEYNSGKSKYTLNTLLLDTAGSLSKMTGVPIGNIRKDLGGLKNMFINQMCGIDKNYENMKGKLAVGAEQNRNIYIGMMVEAHMNGNTALATRIYNDMIRAGVDNETLDDKIQGSEKKEMGEEPALAEGVEAYTNGDYYGVEDAVSALVAKGYGEGMARKKIKSIANKTEKDDDEKTYETIDQSYWNGEEEPNEGDYDLMFNAFKSGNIDNYNEMWGIMEALGKEDTGIRQSMRNHAKKMYQEARESGDYDEAMRAREEFLRLNGKPETLAKVDSEIDG